MEDRSCGQEADNGYPPSRAAECLLCCMMQKRGQLHQKRSMLVDKVKMLLP